MASTFAAWMAIKLLQQDYGHLTSGNRRVSTWRESQTRIPASSRLRALVDAARMARLGGGWISVRVAVGLRHGTDLDGRVHVIAPGHNRLLIQCEQLLVLHRTF